MKAIRLAAILLLAGGAAATVATPVSAQVSAVDAEFNVIPDKSTPTDSGIRLQVILMGYANTPHTVDSVDLKIGEKVYKATDIDGLDFGRSFQFDDTSVQVIELDFPFKGKLPKTATLSFHTAEGEVVAPARQ